MRQVWRHLPSRIWMYSASWCSASRSLLWLSGFACAITQYDAYIQRSR